MNRQSIASMLAPQTTESDATMVDVYGLKSQAADNMAKTHSLLAGLGMIPAVGNVADAVDAMLYLTEGDVGGAGLSAFSMLPIAGLLGGGIKAVKGGAKAIKGGKKLEGVQDIPKMSEKMPRTQTYQFPETEYKTYSNRRVKKLRDRLESEDMDLFEELQVRDELRRLEPEWDEAASLAEQPGTFTSSGEFTPLMALTRGK